MRIALALTMAIAASTHAALADGGPLDPARTGKIQCFAANVESKTCQDLTRFEWTPDGGIVDVDEGTYFADPAITVKMNSPVTVEDGLVCETIVEQPLRSAKFERDGKPVSEADEANLRQALIAHYAPAFGKKVCMELSPYGGEFTVLLSIDGSPAPSATTSLRWVDPGEGYVLAR